MNEFETWLKAYQENYGGTGLMDPETIAKQAWMVAAQVEREFWASKFSHWETCNKSGATFHSIKAQGYKDCAAVLRKNDRWIPR